MSRETGWYRITYKRGCNPEFAYFTGDCWLCAGKTTYFQECDFLKVHDKTPVNPVPADEVKTKTHVNVLNPVYEHDDLTPRIQEAKGWINVKSIYENGLTWDDTKGLKSYDAKTIKTTTTEIRETRVVKEGED